MEIWRGIKGFEDLYEVSNLGRIRSLDRYVKHSKGGLRLIKGSIKQLPPPNFKTGYVLTSLYKDGKSHSFSVHRLVAFAFPEICGEYFDGATVDHIDTVRNNNCANNLRWCTVSENHLNPITYEREKANIQKAVAARKGKPAWNKGIELPNLTGENHWHSRKIKQLDKNRNLVSVWANTRIAAQHLGILSSSIYNCLTGRSKTAGGFIWEYM